MSDEPGNYYPIHQMLACGRELFIISVYEVYTYNNNALLVQLEDVGLLFLGRGGVQHGLVLFFGVDGGGHFDRGCM